MGKKHKMEGFAMDFNPHVQHAGKFISGDCSGGIVLWEPTGDSSWNTERHFNEHKESVEDLSWQCIGDGNVFASASVDKSIRFFDVRQRQSVTRLMDCHDSDVNVISWNPIQGDLLLSGSDCGAVKVWDFRYIDSLTPLAHLKWHKKPITSIAWHPSDEATFAVSSADDSISVWDLSVEPDPDEESVKPEGTRHYPDQMMFHHLGQFDIKEIKWHPYIPGVIISTALDGFNIFKACNM